MARKIKFALKMADGTEVRTIEELKEHFDVETVVGYFNDGRLLNWLQSRYYDNEADKVEQLTKDDPQLHEKLCAIFGVKSEVEELDLEEISRRHERLNKLKQYTADENILAHVDQVAFDQEDLGDLLDEDATLIYLCNNRFTIPLRVTDKTYIGVGKAIAVIRSNKLVDFDALNIKFKGVRFDDNYDALLKAQELAEENKIAAEKAAEEAARPKKIYDEGDTAYDAGDYETALEKYKQAANLGYAKAFEVIGSMYFFGEGVPKDLAVARRWYKLGMDKNDADSFGFYAMTFDNDDATESDKREAFRFMKRATELNPEDGVWWDGLGNMYMEGDGTDKNPHEAIRCYEKGAELGNAYSANKLGNIYYNGKSVAENPHKAFEFYKRAVELDGNYIQAVTNLAWCYRKGYGTDKNSAKAFELYKRAAQEGDADAMTVVGYMLHVGEGVHQDKQEAFTWTKKAAEAGDVQAMKNLAYAYKEGDSTSKNISKATEWYTKATEAGDTDSLNELGRIFFVAGDYQKSAAYFKKSAEAGNGEGMFYIGMYYSNGYGGFPQNERLSFQWYLRAAEAGYVTGMNAVGHCYMGGYGGTTQNLREAERWLKQAADTGDPEGLTGYGDYLLEHGSKSDAAWYYQKAVEGGYGEAAFKLGKMYRDGNGVNKSSSNAQRYFNAAENLGYEVPSDEKSGGCFITTAVCENFGKDDDCYELTAFRNFRDGWLTAQPDGKALIAEYYSIAPAIVNKINSLPNAAQIYEALLTKYLAPCLNLIEHGENLSCKRLYVEMVTLLKKKFLGD